MKKDKNSLLAFMSPSEKKFYQEIVSRPLNKRTLDEELKRQAIEKSAIARRKAWKDKHYDD